MADIFTGILEADGISEELKSQIQETWKSKLGSSFIDTMQTEQSIVSNAMLNLNLMRSG